MKGYVYMINHQDSYGSDQIECYDKSDLMKQIRMIADGDYSNIQLVVEQVKLVNDNDRYKEKPISKSLLAKIEKMLGYKITTSY